MVEQVNHMERDNVESIIKEDSKEVYTVKKNGHEYIVNGDECSCGHTRDYTPSRSASFKQSYHKRRQKSCEHQKAVLNCKYFGACEECGDYEVREVKKTSGITHVMSTYNCTTCGARVGSN